MYKTECLAVGAGLMAAVRIEMLPFHFTQASALERLLQRRQTNYFSIGMSFSPFNTF